MMLMAITATGLSSCVYESYEEPESQNKTDEMIWVRLNVSSLNPLSELSDNTREPLYSIRAVIIDEDGIVEYNQKEVFESPVNSYYFNALVKAGKKKFYFIANAETMTLYESGNPNTESAFFNRFPVGSTGFEAAVNSLYYLNTYYDTDTNPIPLSSSYEMETQPGIQDLQFWLVRAATKYTVHFENSRSASVQLNDLYVSQLADQMYIMPQVGSSQQTISNKYWIDWLREVADKSHEPDSNQGDINFNSTHGWITDYQIPSYATPFDFYLVKEADIEIPGLQTSAGGGEPEPGTKDLGPFYSTEGKNLLTSASGGTQQYTIHIKLTDNKDQKEFSEYRILPNLSALFRNTHVIINITFDESYMHVYGEIADWDEHTTYGDLTEEK